jgi:chromosome segregation ATPase
MYPGRRQEDAANGEKDVLSARIGSLEQQLANSKKDVEFYKEEVDKLSGTSREKVKAALTAKHELQVQLDSYMEQAKAATARAETVTEQRDEAESKRLEMAENLRQANVQ